MKKTFVITDAIAQTIIILNPSGKAIYANRVALDYTGLSLEEVRANNFRDRVFHLVPSFIN